MTETDMKNWGLVSAIWHGVRDLFPTRKTKMAMWGLVGLGVVITYMELMAARLFSSLITSIDDWSTTRTAVVLGGFLVTFAAIRGIGYFQSVYRLTVFERALRRVTSTSLAAESWRWPMAIALVGMLGQIARLLTVTFTVAALSWMYGVLLLLCTAAAVVIVNRTGRQQYAVHHRFVEAKRSGKPPTAAERVSTRIRAGERAGLATTVPVLAYVAALGAGAATDRVTTHAALVLFIAGRMAANMYGSLSMAAVRYIRAQVNVEAYGGRAATRSSAVVGDAGLSDEQVLEALSTGGHLWDPPQQAVARLVDEGRFVGDTATVGRIARESGGGPRHHLRKFGTSTRPDKVVAVQPNQVWLHDAYMMPITDTDTDPEVYLHVVVDVFSRMIVHWHLDPSIDGDVQRLLVEASRRQGVAPDDVDLHSAVTMWGPHPTLHDLLTSLGVARTLLWAAPRADGDARPPDRPPFPTRFDRSTSAEQWVERFVTWYNDVFYQPAVGYLHPSDVQAGLADAIVTKRRGTVESSTRGGGGSLTTALPDDWLPPEEAWLTPVSIVTVPRRSVVSEEHALDEDEEM